MILHYISIISRYNHNNRMEDMIISEIISQKSNPTKKSIIYQRSYNKAKYESFINLELEMP